MMKRLSLFFALFLPLLSVAQPPAAEGAKYIKKLVIDKRKQFNFGGNDSIASYVIDTLIMRDKSSLNFLKKKDVKLTVKHASIGKDCVISGNDGKNNGTNLVLSANFAAMKNLTIDVRGLDAKMANRKFDNGNGGRVVVNYLQSGLKPQHDDQKKPGFLEVNNRGGGYLTNAQSDLPVIYSLLRSGVPGRPLSQLPNGRVYSGGIGSDGKTDVKAVSSLASGGQGQG